MAQAMAAVYNDWTPESSKHTTMTKPSEFPPTPVEATDTDLVDSTKFNPADNDRSTQDNFKERELADSNAFIGLPAPGESSDVATVPPSAKAWPHAKDHDNDPKGRSRSMSNKEVAHLATGVSDFLNKIAPFMLMKDMPEEIRKQWQGLRERTQKAARIAELDSDSDDDTNSDQSSEYAPNKWECTWKRMSMQDWVRLVNDFPLMGVRPSGDVYKVRWSHAPSLIRAFYSDTKLQRVQIASPLLRMLITEATSVEAEHPLLIASPFKLLLGFTPQIQNFLGVLGREVEIAQTRLDDAKTDIGAADDEPGITTDGASYTTEKHKVIEEAEEHLAKATLRHAHLQCYHDFVCSQLADNLQLREQAANGTLKEITFADLWHIFRPGDVLLSSNDGAEQLSQVFHTTGGNYVRQKLTSREYDRAQREERDRQNLRRSRYRDDTDTDDEVVDTVLTTGSWTPFVIDHFSMGFDGVHVGPLGERSIIGYFEGKKNIKDLPIFPIRFHHDEEALLHRLTQRGRKFLHVKGHKSYKGTVWTLETRTPSHTQSDVFIDPAWYFRQWPRDRPRLGPGFLVRSKAFSFENQEAVQGDVFGRVVDQPLRYLHGSEVDDKFAEDFFSSNVQFLQPVTVSDAEKSPERLCLLPHTVIAHIFHLRAWRLVDVDLVQDIDDSNEARSAGWEELIIPDKHKQTLVALVDSHASQKEIASEEGRSSVERDGTPQVQIDLIRGKGQGLIILLHGPPGSGKTSTAETIASYTHRPLYSITCGDIGTTPTEVEDNLTFHLEKAGKWGCVLLLDEADVFLERRGWRELERNALVSVFLRLLEYYSGILFLTTNRIGVIDEAFKSRIHIVLHYPKIDLDGTKLMWTNILNRIEQANRTSEIKIKFDRDSLMKFAEEIYHKQEREDKTWNGRQIRNAFQSALALGRYERVQAIQNLSEEDRHKKKHKIVKLSKAHFKTIAETAREFEDYITRLRGDDQQNAIFDETRDDYGHEIPNRKGIWSSSMHRRPGGPSKTPNRLSPVSPSNARHRSQPETPGKSPRDARASSAAPKPSRLEIAQGKKKQREREMDDESEDLSEEDLSSEDDDEGEKKDED